MKRILAWLLCAMFALTATPSAFAEANADIPVQEVEWVLGDDAGLTEAATGTEEEASPDADEAVVEVDEDVSETNDVTILTIRKSVTKKVYLGTTYRIAVKNKTISSCKSSNTAVAKVSSRGLLRLKKAGTAKITVKTSDGAKLVLTLKVIDPTAATAIAIDEGSRATLTVGDTLQLSYTLKPVTATSAVTWRSSRKAVATVDSATGLVTALTAGRTVVTAKTSTGKKDAITVTVKTAETETETETETTQGPVTLTGDSDGQSYASTTGGENTVLVSGSTVSLTNARVTKSGDSSGDDADFYGTNAAILAKGGATLTVSDTTVTTDGSHANAVFSYGSGTTVNISDSTITTSSNNSGGIMTTGGGTMVAENLTVSTSGNSSAPIRSDRGGGTMKVTGGSYTATGVGSPAIYSTADISVSGATLRATSSEAVVIEGGNSVTLNSATVTGNNSVLNGQSTVKTNVLIYQSMSGDASQGSSTFTMNGGTMTAQTGVMFHVTNVTTTINLSGATFVNAGDTFLTATADSWGTSGKNGGNVTLNLNGQSVTGGIVADSVSSVALNIKGGSAYTGAITGDGTCSVVLSSDSTWKLTGDSYLTSFEGSTDNVDLNGYTLYVNGTAIAA